MTSTTYRPPMDSANPAHVARRAHLVLKRAAKRRSRALERQSIQQGYAAASTTQPAARKPLPDTRSPRKKARDKVYAALPPLKVHKPLAFILEQRPGTSYFDEKGAERHTPDPTAVVARELAEAGKGGAVQRIARGLLLKPAA